MEQHVKGKREAIDLAIATVLAGGHLLIQDVPGVGKTTLAQSLAYGIGGAFARIQFTADLLPGDITGVQILDQEHRNLTFRPGPVFANVVLGDEINRAPPRTQSALLEAMEEQVVTVDGEAHPLPVPFMVVATQNPFDFEGTYPLPESQLDRFLMRIEMGYPDRTSELGIMRQAGVKKAREMQPWTVGEMQECVAAVGEVRVSDELAAYMMDLVRGTRSDHRMKRGVSPRGAQALYRACQAYALVCGRDFVIPDDIWRLAVPVMAHRVVPRAGGGPAGDGGRAAIEELIRELPQPD